MKFLLLEVSHLCKTHTESLILQTGLWSLGLTSATGLWQRQQCQQAETQTHFKILRLVSTTLNVLSTLCTPRLSCCANHTRQCNSEKLSSIKVQTGRILFVLMLSPYAYPYLSTQLADCGFAMPVKNYLNAV